MRPLAGIAVGFDGSSGSRSALSWAASLAAAVGADVVVVHAVGLLEHAGMSTIPAADETAARRVAADAGLDPSRLHWQAVDGDPCTVLRRAAEGTAGVDLIVVGTRGSAAHPGLLGSTSLGLAERATVPVVIVPGDHSG